MSKTKAQRIQNGERVRWTSHGGGGLSASRTGEVVRFIPAGKPLPKRVIPKATAVRRMRFSPDPVRFDRYLVKVSRRDGVWWYGARASVLESANPRAKRTRR